MAEAKLKISLDGADSAIAKLKALASAMGQGIANAVTSAASSWGKFKSGLMSVKGALGAVGAYKFGGFVIDTIKMADAADKATRAYTRMGGTVKGLDALRESLGGGIGGHELAKAGVQAMRANAGLTAEQFELMARFAKQAADATGTDFAGALDEVNAAMMSGRPAALRRLGLHVDTDKAVKAAASAQHKLVASLSDEAKHGAVVNAVLAEMRMRLEGLRPGQKTAGASLAELSANWDELKEHMGAGFGEMLGPALRGINDVAAGRKGVGGALLGTAGAYGRLINEVSGHDAPDENRFRKRTVNVGQWQRSIKVDKITTRSAGG